MNRRDFVATGLSSLVTCTCGYARKASAKAAIRGCRMAAAGDDERSEMRGLLRRSSGIGSGFDNMCNVYADILRTWVGVRAGFCFYEDGPDDKNKNALADPYPYFPDQGHDGTVMLGIQLTMSVSSTTKELSVTHGPMNFGVVVVMAHEFGHILQFKEHAANAWEMEPHADFMAGWAIAKIHEVAEFWVGPQATKESEKRVGKRELEEAVETMFSFGDNSFNDREHHGEPHYRAVMVRAGFDAGNLGVKEAFEKGLTWSGLKRNPT